MSSYVLNTDGSVVGLFNDKELNDKSHKDMTTFIAKNFDIKNDVIVDNNIVTLNIPSKLSYISTVETLGDFKSGTNFAENKHSIFKEFDNYNVLPDNFDISNIENLQFDDITDAVNGIPLTKIGKDLINKSRQEPFISGVIGKSKKLYSNAHGLSMNFENNTNKEDVTFYTPYNSFFDLDLNYSGRADNETGLEIFADEVEMLYGVPHLLHDPDKFVGDLSNVFTSLTDMLVGAIIPIAAMTVLQGLLQSAQQGPPDPFSLFGPIRQGKPDSYGKFITYVKIDPIYNPILSTIFNPIIEGLVSLLKTTERLMNFPANPLQKGNFLLEIGRILIKNTICFCLGYIYYLIPGFKIESKIFSTSPAAILTSLFSILTSLSGINKSKHNYNLLIRKIAKNNYFRRRIQFKAKEITDKDGNIYNYDDQIWYQLSDFFHRFIGERLAVGQKVFDSLYASEWNKRNTLFSVQKMNELPLDFDSGKFSTAAPLSLGSSIIGSADPAADQSAGSAHFNKSIYSINSLITKTSSANSYMAYHNELIKQNEAIYQKKQRRLPKQHVQKLEALINSDYMPFSIQDLRTNEIFKFHAFVENYGDSFNVGWDDAATGFGRMDAVKTYKGTSRSISVDFWLVAMSSDDFDYMWWMVNRLIALIYPQWSAPKPANVENQLRSGVFFKDSGKFRGIPFGQPFTQIPTGSPVIRLRLGDIFTSNYSKKGLARIFGFDLKEMTDDDKSINYFNSSLKMFNSDSIKNTFIKKSKEINEIYSAEVRTQPSSKNEGSKNLTINLIGYQIIDLDDLMTHVNEKAIFPFNRLDQLDFEKYTGDEEFKFSTEHGDIRDIGYSNILTNKYSNFHWPEKSMNEEAEVNLDDINNPPKIFGNDTDIAFPKGSTYSFKKLIYINTVIIEDGEKKSLILLYEVMFPSFVVDYKTGDAYLKAGFKTSVEILIDLVKKGIKFKSLNKTNQVYTNKNLQAFMSADGQKYFEKFGNPTDALLEDDNYKGVVNNPIVKSFESTMGEGLAGTIQGFTLGFDQQIPWELEEGSRAPIAIKVGLQMSVIHDILPGLDDQGVMRAPTYRVGKINNEFFGKSVYEEIPDDISYSNPRPVNPYNTNNTTNSKQPPTPQTPQAPSTNQNNPQLDDFGSPRGGNAVT